MSEKPLDADDVCPFSYETCQKYGKICRETFMRSGDASFNDCPIAVHWQECFREHILVPYRRKRKAIQKLKAQKGEQ